MRRRVRGARRVSSGEVYPVQKALAMPIRIVQLGTRRLPDEGLRLGTVRRPPRGVPKSQFASRNFYDVWVPDLAPGAEVIKAFQNGAGTDADWRRFERRYRSEMKQPERVRLCELLA